MTRTKLKNIMHTKIGFLKAATNNNLINKTICDDENVEVTWKHIGTLINRKKSNSLVTIIRLYYDNNFYTDEASIGEQPNNYFINTGNKLFDQLPLHNTNPCE